MTIEQSLELINEFTERETGRHVEWPERGIVTLVDSDYEFADGFKPKIRVDLNMHTKTIECFIGDSYIGDLDSSYIIDDICRRISSMSYEHMIGKCVSVGEKIFVGVKNREQGEFMISVNKYSLDEFDSYAYMDADGIIPLAFTEYTFGDDDYEIQVSFDINKVAFINYIDGEVVLVEPRDSLKEAGQEISECSFDEMIYNCLCKGYELYGD